jgi:shikimate kinase
VIRHVVIRHVVILGLMGAGKSSVGNALAKRLGWPHHDNDASIGIRTGETAREITRTEGLDELHRLEADDLLAALAPEAEAPTIISGAASVIDDARCREALVSPDVFVAWLRADASVLADRASRGRHRPEIEPDLEALLERQARERDPLFESVADLVLDAASSTPDELALHLEAALDVDAALEERDRRSRER